MTGDKTVLTQPTNFAVRVALLAMGTLIVAGTAAALYLGMKSQFSVDAFEQLILSWGAWGVAASIILMIIHSFVPFPAELLALANGMIYGPFWGTVITWAGAMCGAAIAFGLARSLGRPFVELMVSEKRLSTLDNWTALRGGRLILVSRLFPIIAFNLVNYAAGLTRISWWTFTWATAIGILPMTFLMVLMGDNIENLEWWFWLLLIPGILVLWIILRILSVNGTQGTDGHNRRVSSDNAGSPNGPY